MIPTHSGYDTWPWSRHVTKLLSETRRERFLSEHLFLASDYGGEHAESMFRTYAFLMLDADSSDSWPAAMSEVRNAYLPDKRRMAYKNLNDIQRQRALVPFLKAAETLTGHLVVFAVHKNIKLLTSTKSSLDVWSSLRGRKVYKKVEAFERMARVAHFVALLLARWTAAGTDISWVTDEDELVANSARHDEAHHFTASFCGVYVPHRLGEFAMLTPAILNSDFGEDILAIPDLAAGMLADTLTNIPRSPLYLAKHSGATTSQKNEVIADWFNHDLGSLRKLCILFDRADQGAFTVGRANFL